LPLKVGQSTFAVAAAVFVLPAALPPPLVAAALPQPASRAAAARARSA
jgi:hypothetical protein